MTVNGEGAISKNMLNSFRNGPVKIIGGGASSSALHKGIRTTVAASTRPIASAQTAASSTSGGLHHPGRPSSAPTKRPASPGGSGAALGSNVNASASGQQRVKYNKNSSA